MSSPWSPPVSPPVASGPPAPMMPPELPAAPPGGGNEAGRRNAIPVGYLILLSGFAGCVATMVGWEYAWASAEQRPVSTYVGEYLFADLVDLVRAAAIALVSGVAGFASVFLAGLLVVVRKRRSAALELPIDAESTGHDEPAIGSPPEPGSTGTHG